MYFLSVYVSRELCCLTAAVKVADTGNNGNDSSMLSTCCVVCPSITRSLVVPFGDSA